MELIKSFDFYPLASLKKNLKKKKATERSFL